MRSALLGVLREYFPVLVLAAIYFLLVLLISRLLPHSKNHAPKSTSGMTQRMR